MTPRTPRRFVLGLTVLAMLVAACGGSTATNTPGSSATAAPATAAPATPAPATAAPATATPGATPGFSFALPSFTGDQELEDMFPDTIGGEAVGVVSMTGDEFLGDGTAAPEIAAVLADLGKTTDDLSVAFGGNTKVTVIAFRLKGVTAGTLFDAFKEAQTEEYTAETVTYGGRSVTKLTPSNGEVVFIYSTGDVMFVVGGETVTDAILNETFAALP